jgi:GH24 family phage-related lysozyme (muramidase)
MVRDNTNVKLSQNQFDALVIFAYNTGRYEGTTLEKKVNSGESMEKIGDAFRMWNKITNEDTKKLEVSQGLVNRREDEVEMYQTGDYNRDH